MSPLPACPFAAIPPKRHTAIENAITVRKARTKNRLSLESPFARPGHPPRQAGSIDLKRSISTSQLAQNRLSDVRFQPVSRPENPPARLLLTLALRHANRARI